MALEFRTVGVVGLGTMGAGIVEVFAKAGLRVVGVEPTEEALGRGRGHLQRSTERAVSRGKLSEADRDAQDVELVVDRAGRQPGAGGLLASQVVDEVLDVAPTQLAHLHVPQLGA